MDPQVKIAKMKTALRTFMVVAWVLTIGVVIYMGPKIEQLLFPVISKFEIIEEQTYVRDGVTYISGVVVKERPECIPIQIVGFAEYTDNPTVNRKTIRVEIPGEKPISLPEGAQFWGPLGLRPAGPPLGPVFTIRAIYNCHPFWKLRVTLYTGLTADFFSKDQIEGVNP